MAYWIFTILASWCHLYVIHQPQVVPMLAITVDLNCKGDAREICAEGLAKNQI